MDEFIEVVGPYLETATISGLNRTAFPPPQSNQWREESLSAAEQVLQWASMQALSKRAGFEPELKDESKDEICKKETRPYINAAAVECLDIILKGNNRGRLEEFIRLTIANKLLVTPSFLPRLFQQVVHNKLSPDFIFEIGGMRSEWLAKNHPGWKKCLPPDFSDWETGDQDMRLRYFMKVRAASPEEGRRLLKENHEKMPHEELAKLTRAMQVHLSDEDEPILAILQQHRRKEVRQIAMIMLSKLANSDFVAEMKHRLEDVISIQKSWLKSPQLTIELPEITQSVQSKYGWNGKALANTGMGEKAAILCQILATIPPSHWEEKLEVNTPELIAAAQSDEWTHPLMLGWALATINHKDELWAAHILEGLLSEKQATHSNPPFPLATYIPRQVRTRLWSLLDQETISKLLSKAIKAIRTPGDNLLGWQSVIDLPQGIQLDTDLVQLYAYSLIQFLIKHGNRANYGFREFIHELKKVPNAFPAGIFPEIARIWATDPFQPAWYHRHLEEAVQIMGFRHRMHNAFSS